MSATLNKTAGRTHADEIITDSGRTVRITHLDPNAKIRVYGRTVRARDIPLSIYHLECTHTGKGIGVAVGDVLFCEPCGTTKSVTSSRS